MSRTVKVVIGKQKPKLRAKKLSISITGEAGEKLAGFCEREERSPSWTIDKLILRYLELLEKR
jgi:hypothetical protein